MDVMWVWSMSWGCSAATIKPRHSRPSETCPPLKEIPDEGARRRRNCFFLTQIIYFFVISDPILSPLQTRWTWCECKTCHGAPRRASDGVQKWRQRMSSSPKWWCTIHLLGCTHYFFVISDPIMSPLQIRQTWCECEACHGAPRRASDGVQKWRQRLGSSPKWQHAIYLWGGTRQQAPKCVTFLLSLTQNWVLSRSDGRDVSIKHVMGMFCGHN